MTNSFFEMAVEFSCPSCKKMTTLGVAIESKSSDPDEAAQSAKGLPLKCHYCHKLAAAGTGMHVKLRPISAKQYAQWVQKNQKSLRIHKDTKSSN